MTATEFPDWLAATLASDASGGVGVLPAEVTARRPDAIVVGPALCVTVTENDNSPMRDVAAVVPQPGTVLVVGGADRSRTAILGDLVARELLRAGIVAVVTDGPIRDCVAVAELGLSVWSRGVTPIASKKAGTGSVGVSTRIGDVQINDGDLVIADADGVVIWPVKDVPDLLTKADAKLAADDAKAASFGS